MDLAIALWRGDVPLAKTYWLFGVTAMVLFRIAFRYIEYQGAPFASGFNAFFVLVLFLFYFVYSGFIYVAIWRSADKYQGLKRYRILAKFAVVLGVMALTRDILEIFSGI